MLQIATAAGTRLCEGVTRREILRAGAIGLGGLTLPGLLQLQQTAGAPALKAKARSVIMLFLSGGPSQLDMWDLKPGAAEEIRGTFRPIATSVPGLQIGEHLPRMAKLAGKYTVIRSMTHNNPSHPPATYWMMVGSPMQRAAPQKVTMSREDRPHPGSAAAMLLPRKAGLPPFVMVPEAISPVGPERPGQHAGFLGAAYDPYRVNSDPNLPDYDPGALGARAEMTNERLDGRRQLLAQIAQRGKQVEQSAVADSLDRYYVRAFDLVSSPAAQKAFDISLEPAKTRDRYGRHVFGQSVLLARRLVEAGVRLIHVNWVRHDNANGGQGYDSHRDHLAWSKTELHPPTDAAFSSLIEDLSDRGLLDETLVLMIGEFGRTPKFNAAGGRDHWANCFSAVIAGGGTRGGRAYGSSDKIAAYPTSDPVTPDDLITTLYHCLGIDPQTLLHDGLGRPFRLVEGTPVTGLF